MWDKSKVYGYPDEVILEGWPEDNRVAKEGCGEILTREEIRRMFPNQVVVVEICDYDKIPEYWTMGKVLYYQCSTDFASEYILKNNKPFKLLISEPTYSDTVIGRWLDMFLLD